MRHDSLGPFRTCDCAVGGMGDPVTAVSTMTWIFLAALGYGFYRLVK